jgi:ribosomal protein S12 methylthiotransferase accessory factor
MQTSPAAAAACSEPVAVVGLGPVGTLLCQHLLAAGFHRLVLADGRLALGTEGAPLSPRAAGVPRAAALKAALEALYPEAELIAARGPEEGAGWRYEAVSGCRLLLLAAEGPVPAILHEVNAAALELGRPLLPGILLPGGPTPVAQLGPWVALGSACLQCLERRVLAAARRKAYPEPPGPATAPQRVQRLVQRLSRALAGAAAGYWSGDGAAPGPNRVHYLSPAGAARSHGVLRSPGCPACGDLGPFLPYRLPGPAADDDRDDTPDPERILRLEGDLVDPWCGVIRSLARRPPPAVDPGIEVWAAEAATLREEVSVGGGFSLDPREARSAALGEALERASVLLERPEDTVTAPYTAVREYAVNPTAWDLFHPTTRADPAFPYPAVTPETPLHWVWGERLEAEGTSPLLVPASRVFLRFTTPLPEGHPDYPLVSGFATGSTLADATRRGWLEVLERDAFMIAWANRLPLQRVPLTAESPHGIGRYVGALEARGFELRCGTLTLDLGVHLAISLLRFPGPAGPAVIVTAAADLDRAEACRRAIKEGAAGPPLLFRHFADAGGRLPEPVPEQVTTMEQHALLYARPEMFHHLEPWWEAAPGPDLSAEGSRGEGRTPGEALRILARGLEARGLSAVRVDLTQPALRELGLFTVKVVVPGAYPMNFDSRWPHFGGERIYRAPVVAGLQAEPLSFEALNRIPHPFP